MIYIHKETGFKITLEELKNFLRTNNDRVNIAFARPYTLSANDFSEEYVKELIVDKYSYYIKDIPFSDDFECITGNRTDFSMEDLKKIDKAVDWIYSFDEEKLKRKIKIIMEQKANGR